MHIEVKPSHGAREFSQSEINRIHAACSLGVGAVMGTYRNEHRQVWGDHMFHKRLEDSIRPRIAKLNIKADFSYEKHDLIKIFVS